MLEFSGCIMIICQIQNINLPAVFSFTYTVLLYSDVRGMQGVGRRASGVSDNPSQYLPYHPTTLPRPKISTGGPHTSPTDDMRHVEPSPINKENRVTLGNYTQRYTILNNTIRIKTQMVIYSLIILKFMLIGKLSILSNCLIFVSCLYYNLN